jgi:hypothetical protein
MLEASATGYIENAIVGNQIRIRVDSAFHQQDPDRAEFFYAKCGCYRSLSPTNSAYDPHAPGPGNGIAKAVNFQEVHVNLEYAPISRLSFFADVPGRSLQYTSATDHSMKSASGLGDFSAGFKLALVASPQRFLTFQFGSLMPTGHSDLGLGTNHFSVQPMLLYNQRLGERVSIAGEFGDWHPVGGSAGVPTNSSSGFPGDVITYGVGTSYDFLSGSENRITPVLEFVGWSVHGGFATTVNGAEHAGGNILNAKIGVRFSFHHDNSIYLGFGHVITNASWYDEIVRLEYRHSF